MAVGAGLSAATDEILSSVQAFARFFRRNGDNSVSSTPAAQGRFEVGGEVYKNGDRIQSFIKTPKGELEVIGQVRIEGKTLQLDRMSVFPKFSEKLHPGGAAMRSLMRGLADEARAQGFETLRFTGGRISGAGPGRLQDIIIDLTK